MIRSINFDIPFETRLFTPFQLQPKSLCEIISTGFSRWTQEHLFSFPRLINEHRVSVVVAGIQLEYLRPLTFFDADTLDINFSLTVRAEGKMLVLNAQYKANDELVARSQLRVIPVLISDETLSALPGKLPPAVYERFTEDERIEGRPERYVNNLALEIEANGRYLHSYTHHFFLHRHICEVADQWSYTDLVSHVAASREMMALEHGQDIPELMHGLSQPLKQVDAELSRPYYAFDNGLVESKAYCHEGRLALIHHLYSDIGSNKAHAVVIERF